MDYQRHYERLISRARRRELTGYSERHHVVPRCLGGGDAPDNIVRLTAEEHYLAHLLLVKMHPGNHRLLWAAVGMTNGTGRQDRKGNKLYGWLRRAFAERVGRRNKGRKASPELRARMSAQRKGRKRAPHSPETKAKMSAAAKGRPKSAEHRANLAAAKRGKKRGPHSEEHRKRLKAAIRESIATRKADHLTDPGYRKRQAETMRRVWAERKRKAGAATDNS